MENSQTSSARVVGFDKNESFRKMNNRKVYFTINGVDMVGELTGRDYEEIEVTTEDGSKYYLDDQWLDHKPEPDPEPEPESRFLKAKRAEPMDDPSELVPYGWAPGGYFCTACNDCGEPFMDSDKRSRRCQDCAKSLKDKQELGLA